MEKSYFDKYRENLIKCSSIDDYDKNNSQRIYADWCGSGRIYEPIEMEILNKYGPYYSNLHSSSDNPSMIFIEEEYYKKRDIIKQHFGANQDYELILNGQGMTTAINQCIEILKQDVADPNETVVIISPYEHNSNFITWKVNGYKIEILRIDEDGFIDLDYYENILKKYFNMKKIVSITACSNVTGIILDIEAISNIGKKYGAIVVVDYTACAPYIDIDVTSSKIDVMVCSVHKFVGGVQGVGILIIRSDLYKRVVPTKVGGGTVRWINPKGDILYWNDISRREEAGTVPILQTIRSALAIELKEHIGINKIEKRELEISNFILNEVKKIKNIKLFTPNVYRRLPIFSFNIYGERYKDIVNKLFTDFGIQVRGGCCCASIFAHTFLRISDYDSKKIYYRMKQNNQMENQMGWVRISLNYMTSDIEINKILNCLKHI